MSTFLRHGILESKKPDVFMGYECSVDIQDVYGDLISGNYFNGTLRTRNDGGDILDSHIFDDSVIENENFYGINEPYYIDFSAIAIFRNFIGETRSIRWKIGEAGEWVESVNSPASGTYEESIILIVQVKAQSESWPEF